MDHDKIPEELDDLISDIHDLIDDSAPEAEEPSSEIVMPEEPQPELPAEEPPAEPEGGFQQRRWTERQKVPKHVARLQQNQEEAYARWLEEQEGKAPEPPPEIPEETPKKKRKKQSDGETQETARKKRPGLWCAVILIAVMLAVALTATWIVPRQPKAESGELRVRGAVTIVLAGTDDSFAHTDMLMLMSMDPRHDKLSLISIPRDTAVQTKDGVVSLGSVYGRAGGGQEGIQALTEAVSGCIGYAPDGCVVVHPQSLIKFADILGGIEFDLPRSVQIGNEQLRAGPRLLDGQTAYEVLRLRQADETLDLQRVELQQQFLEAVIHQCTSLKGVLRAPQLLDALMRTVVTDMGTANLMWLGRSALGMDQSGVYTATLPGDEKNGSYILDGQQVLQTVNGYCSPYISAITEDDLAITAR